MSKVRTRFAPSPTGYMHIGNLRTALYEYLIAKSQNGDFVLRIEDTDRSRYVEGAEEVIYNTLKSVGLKHDEGPDIGGNYGPYVQSERKGEYLKYAKQLVEKGAAYYCFCEKNDTAEGHSESGHSDKCRELNESEVEELLKSGKKYVIRQKMPKEGTTSFEDAVFGTVTVENKELEDQILIKSDGYPTYNFANVVDDHEMAITHVVRGCEYLSSTPKYNLLYEALQWQIPVYVHLPLIMGQNEDGTVSKLSKSPANSVSSPRIISVSLKSVPVFLTPGIKEIGISQIYGICFFCIPPQSSAIPAGADICGTSKSPPALVIIPDAITALGVHTSKSSPAASLINL